MTDPVRAPDGTVFDRAAIETYLWQHGKHPFTQTPLTAQQLTADIALRDAIAAASGQNHYPQAQQQYNPQQPAPAATGGYVPAGTGAAPPPGSVPFATAASTTTAGGAGVPYATPAPGAYPSGGGGGAQAGAQYVQPPSAGYANAPAPSSYAPAPQYAAAPAQQYAAAPAPQYGAASAPQYAAPPAPQYGTSAPAPQYGTSAPAPQYSAPAPGGAAGGYNGYNAAPPAQNNWAPAPAAAAASTSSSWAPAPAQAAAPTTSWAPAPAGGAAPAPSPATSSWAPAPAPAPTWAPPGPPVAAPPVAAPPVAPTPGSAPAANNKPRCRYAGKCYRKNPQHWADYDHAGQTPPPGVVVPAPVAAGAAPGQAPLNGTATVGTVRCDAQCQVAHHAHGNCLVCGQAWSTHRGHTCNSGQRGAWNVPAPAPATAPAPAPAPPAPVGCANACQLNHQADGNCLMCGLDWSHHSNGHTCRSGARGSWQAGGNSSSGHNYNTAPAPAPAPAPQQAVVPAGQQAADDSDDDDTSAFATLMILAALQAAARRSASPDLVPVANWGGRRLTYVALFLVVPSRTGGRAVMVWKDASTGKINVPFARLAPQDKRPFEGLKRMFRAQTGLKLPYIREIHKVMWKNQVAWYVASTTDPPFPGHPSSVSFPDLRALIQNHHVEDYNADALDALLDALGGAGPSRRTIVSATIVAAAAAAAQGRRQQQQQQQQAPAPAPQQRIGASGKPMCRYAPRCYQQKLAHWQQFDHGAQPPPQAGRLVIEMWHCTTAAAAAAIRASGFRQSVNGTLGRGVYVSRDKRKALNYGNVELRLRVTMHKVKCIAARGGMQRTWHQNGYDAAWVPAGKGVGVGMLEETCVWDPAKIEIFDPATGQFRSYPQSHVP